MTVYLIATEEWGSQSAHTDFEMEFEVGAPLRPWILHCPLCKEGMWILIWTGPHHEGEKPLLVHIPFGRMMLLKSDVVHSGCYGQSGNLRLHAVFRHRARPEVDSDSLYRSGPIEKPQEPGTDPITFRQLHFDPFKEKVEKPKQEIPPLDWTPELLDRVFKNPYVHNIDMELHKHPPKGRTMEQKEQKADDDRNLLLGPYEFD